MESIRCWLNFDNCFVVNAHGCSGGLCLSWNKDVRLSIRSLSNSHILCGELGRENADIY